MNYSKIEYIRNGKKVSRQELVDGIEISISTYKKNLVNQNMTIAVLERIAKFLEVPVSEFFWRLLPILKESTTRYKRSCSNSYC